MKTYLGVAYHTPLLSATAPFYAGFPDEFSNRMVRIAFKVTYVEANLIAASPEGGIGTVLPSQNGTKITLLYRDKRR